MIKRIEVNSWLLFFFFFLGEERKILIPKISPRYE